MTDIVRRQQEPKVVGLCSLYGAALVAAGSWLLDFCFGGRGISICEFDSILARFFLSYESLRHLEHAMEKDHQLRDEAEDSAHPEGSGNPYPCRFLGLGRLLSGLAGSTYTGVRTCLQVCTTV